MINSLNILIVDDDKICRFLIKNLLKEICKDLGNVSLEIIEHADGAETVSYLQNQKQSPNLIVLDLNMPVMDGFQFLEWLRRNSNHANAKVVISTSSITGFDKKRAEELGVNAYYVKPLGKEHLTKCLALAGAKLV